MLPKVGGREGVADELEAPDPEGEERPVVRSEGEASDVGRGRCVDRHDNAPNRCGARLAAGEDDRGGKGNPEGEEGREAGRSDGTTEPRAVLSDGTALINCAA